LSISTLVGIFALHSARRCVRAAVFVGVMLLPPLMAFAVAVLAYQQSIAGVT
jgi:hypothetical protein